MKNLLNEKFDPKTFINLGNRKLRTKTESDSQSGMDATELTEKFPQCYPVTFLDVSGMTVGSVIPDGGSGYVVMEQKSVRKLTENQVKNRRESMKKLYPDLAKQFNGKPFYVINARTVGSRIDLTPIDKIEIIKTRAPEIYAALFNGKTDAEQLAMIEPIWESINSVK